MRRALLLLLALPLAACAAGPQSLGITGPEGAAATSTAPPAGTSPPADPLDNPGLMQPGFRYGPSSAPSTGSGSFWGYN